MIEIGSRRELFLDDLLIDTEKTTAEQVYCAPEKKEAAFVHDAAWENRINVYHNIVKYPDGAYRMFYKAVHYGEKPDGVWSTINHICALESRDGIHWTRPNYRITPFKGNYDNNIISGQWDYYDNLFVFKDENPDAPADARYKAIFGGCGEALNSFNSRDGLHFVFYPFPDDIPASLDANRLMSTEETGCYFDTLNTIYYDKAKKKYVGFVRGFHIGDETHLNDPDDPRAIRDIRYTESEDYVHWTMPEPIKFNDDNDYQLYANAVVPYYRAPHMYLAHPTRYVARPDWNDSFEKLPNVEERRWRGRGQSITDAIFMCSRDGMNWTRTNEAVFTPGPEHMRNWLYGDCYPCVGYIETPGEVEGTDPRLSMFCKEDVEGKQTVLYRYELRMDGFGCRRATYAPQMLVTKPFTFEGKELEINFATSAIGYMKFTLKAEDGREIHSGEVFGDKIDRIVGFEDGNVADFAGVPVTLSIEMSDASLYSMKFNA